MPTGLRALRRSRRHARAWLRTLRRPPAGPLDNGPRTRPGRLRSAPAVPAKNFPPSLRGAHQ
jgi:hypothetical protein